MTTACGDLWSRRPLRWEIMRGRPRRRRSRGTPEGARGTGPQRGYERSHARVDEVEFLGEVEPLRRSERAALQEAVAPAVGGDGPVSRAHGAGVHAEDDHAALGPVLISGPPRSGAAPSR